MMHSNEKKVDHKIPLIDVHLSVFLLAIVRVHKLVTFTQYASSTIVDFRSRARSAYSQRSCCYSILSLVSLMILSYSISLHINLSWLQLWHISLYGLFSAGWLTRIVHHKKLHSHHSCRLSNLMARSRLAISFYNRTMVIECLLSQRAEINRLCFDETCDRVRFLG